MQDERRKRQEHLLTAISLFVFIIFSLFVISVRSADIYHSDENLQNINDFTGVLGGWPLGLRAGGAWLAMGTEYVLRAVSRLFIVTPIEFPLYTGANWPIWTITLERMDGFIVPLLSNYTYKIILLLPIWACIRILFRGAFSQILACIIVGSALGGWGPYIANLFFFVAKQVSDWPVYYGIYSERIWVFDYAMLFYTFLLLAYLLRTERPRTAPVIGLAALGQLCFENLGLVTGIALASFVLMSPESSRSNKFRAATRSFVSAGIGSAPVFAGLAVWVLFYKTGIADGGQSVRSWGQWAGAANFADIPFLIANILTLWIPPVFFGAILGVFCGALRSPTETKTVVHEFNSVLAVTVAMLFSIFIGLFFAGYLSDMGRQMISFVVLLVLISAKMLELIIVSRRAGFN